MPVKREVFETEAVRHLDALYGYAMRLARNPERAEDLVQETYARAAAAIHRLPEKAAIRPTLFRILHNLFVDEWRAIQRGPVMISTQAREEEDRPLPLVSPGDDPRQALLRNALSDEVEAALETLHDSWRETLWLREVEGYSYEEISSLTRVPVGSVRSRLARARRALADKLKDFVRHRGNQEPAQSSKGTPSP